MSEQDREELRRRFERLKQLKATYDNKRAALIGKLEEKKQRCDEAKDKLKELGIDPEQADEQILAMRNKVLKQIKEYTTKLEVEIEKLENA